MLYSDSLSVSPENHLMIGRHDAVALAREFGTPLYVLDEDLMRRNCREYRETLRQFCGDRAGPGAKDPVPGQIGRASCRERVLRLV